MSVIILMMVGFLTTALGRATRSARQTANQRSAEALAASVEQFRLEFGFLPPLVHDGRLVSGTDIRPWNPNTDAVLTDEGPVTEEIDNGAYVFRTVIVWSEGYDFNFFRRRAGDAADLIELSSTGGNWDDDSAWDDRRYSRYALAYYLAGALPRSIDGIAGEGMTRPLANGWFQGVGYPMGSTRGRYQSTIDTNRQGIEIQVGYARPIEIAEHDLSRATDELAAGDVYSLYPADDQDYLISVVDIYGTAFRYYRWEHGRYEGTQLVIENSLDLNIPPVLLDPELLVVLLNDDNSDPKIDLTNGNIKLREARFAVVGAGPDRLFGTEPMEYLIDQLNVQPPGDLSDIAQIRKQAMEDNVVALGK